MPGLSDVVDEFFVANAQHVIVQDTLPQAVGQGIGGLYVNFSRGTLERITPDGQTSRDPNMLLGELNENGVVRRYLMYLVRPLAGRPGWLTGASYRSSALVKVFAQGALGVHGLAALIDTRRGGVQAVAGPAAINPKLSVADTAMFKAFQDSGYSGVWTGPTGMDDVERIHAYHRVPGRDLVAVVGLDLNDWMAPANAWAQSARVLAGMASLLVVAIGGLVLWWLWTLETNRRLRHALVLTRKDLRAAQLYPDGGEVRGAASTAQVRSMLDASADGAALFGADWRLLAWNPSFATESGLPPEALQRGLPLNEMLRRQPPRPQAAAPTPDDETVHPAGQRDAPAEGDATDPPVSQPEASPVPHARSAHLVERVAERLLRSGALDASASHLLARDMAASQSQPVAATGATGSGRPPQAASAGVLRERTAGGAEPPPASRGLASPEFVQGPQAIDLIALERAGMVDWSRTRSRVSEEFRLAQRQLLTTAFSGANAQSGFSNLVMVTSARPGEGKSFMALNLAGSIARQGDHSVLLVDANSKRNSFCYPLGLANSPGLLDLAANPRLDAAQCIVKTPIDRLSILPVGRERERSRSCSPPTRWRG